MLKKRSDPLKGNSSTGGIKVAAKLKRVLRDSFSSTGTKALAAPTPTPQLCYRVAEERKKYAPITKIKVTEITVTCFHCGSKKPDRKV